MEKLRKILLIAGILTGLLSASAFAGEWRQTTEGYRYAQDDGSFLTDTWEWIDGNQDGIAECYYFDGSGYCLTDCDTPDGYTVDINGAWIVDGVVQTKLLQDVPAAAEQSQDQSAENAAPKNTASSGSGASAASGEDSRSSSSDMVWLSATGEKYHRIPDCGRMNPSKARSVTREYAISAGYDACKKCRP